MILPLKIIGVSHKTASILSRELFDSQILNFTSYIRSKYGPEVEFVAISTCNRSEVVLSGLDLSDSEMRSFFSNLDGIYIKEGREAIKHFFAVCAGLDSLVLGEAEIFGQVKNAYRASTEKGTVGLVLHRLFQESFRVAKKLRSNTNIGRGSLSMASLAVMQASRIFGSIEDRKALVIGAGDTGALAARILRQQKIDKLFICNRTYSKALNLCEELDAIPLPFNKFKSILGIVDIIVVAVSFKAGTPILNREILGEKYYKSGYSPLCILDLSVPRMVQEEVNMLDSVYSFCVDDLSPLVDENLKLRQSEAIRAEAIMEEEIEFVLKWFRSRGEASQGLVKEEILKNLRLNANR